MEFYTHTYPVARKEHICEFCNCIVPKGKRYSCEKGKYDGELFTRKLCPECNGMLHDWFNDTGENEFDWWEITDWLRDTYCCDCKNKEDCNQEPNHCEIIRSQFPHEISKILYEN